MAATSTPRFTITDPSKTPALDPRITHDAETGLDWQTIPFPEAMTDAEAVAACKALRLGGFDDWRVPTLPELESIRDLTRCDPAIDPEAFPGTPSTWFRTSTPYVKAPSEYAWIVYFDGGGSYIYRRDGYYRVRAVRGPSRQSSGSLGG